MVPLMMQPLTTHSDGLNGTRPSSPLHYLHSNHGWKVRVQEHGQQNHGQTRTSHTIGTAVGGEGAGGTQ